jgi:hypothetical protein
MFKHDRRHIDILASILTTKHGARATEVAYDRARKWIDVGDEVRASLWTEVSQAIAEGPSAPLIPPKAPPRAR